MSSVVGASTLFTVCPVCRRNVSVAGGVRLLFYRHNDKIGKHCPMSGQPMPEPDGTEA